ncbi:MAG TPA: serpin family protein, partial [Candidatus Wallbacteria bacterium]|nr:serpin family protein [Candidatus Wallbacteria bacterium]
MKSTIYCFLLMSIAIIFFIALSIIDLSVSFAQGKSKTPVPQKQVSIPPPSEVIKMNQRQNYQPSSHEPPVAPLTEEEIGKYNELIGRIDRDIIISGLKFSFNIFSGAVKQNDKPNTFISPFSVMQALLLTYNGAAGETKTAMEKTFYLENIDSEKLAATNIAFNKLIENIDPKVEMSVANSVWTKTGLAFSEEYLKKNTQIYNAEVKSVDFKSADAVPAINKWVSDKTRGKISPAVERLPENLTVMLINAIYFKGAWTSKFNPDNTRDEDFNAPGGVKKVKMMTQGGSFEYMKNEEFQAIKMYYGARRRVAMYLFLPVSGSGLDKFIA